MFWRNTDKYGNVIYVVVLILLEDGYGSSWNM